MKIFIILISVFISGCATLKNASYHPTAPGYLKVEITMRDKVKSVSLNPASLFDPDDSISVFRLGFYWQPKMGEDVDFLVSIPSRWDADVNHIEKNIKDLLIIKGDKKIHLQKAQNPVKLKHTTAYGRKEFYLEYRFAGNKKLLKEMLNEKDVRVQLTGPGKLYDARFDINNKYRVRYKNNKHNAYNGADRFVKVLLEKS